MKKLSKSEYLRKLRGCWLGKAIGGTLGATFEAKRGAFDLDFYPEDPANGMIPNDDLDLQLVFLNAIERYKTEISAEKLSDYWMAGILPNWAEYGVGKSNIRAGLNAPASGKHNNRFKDSNGAWIRSEIWACIAPGHPEIAVKYAIEDASVDHADEGIYAEMFTVALESAAFAESDKYKLIDIALSYIPADCDCAGAVRKMIDLYRSGIDWKAARVALLNAYPDSFGGQLGCVDPDVPNGRWGYDAPANLALTLMGWLYAENDFGRAICITAGCGEDGDCTTSALGAVLGIILGDDGIPQRWKAPIGEEIKTICVSRFASMRIPKTLTELARRTANLVPAFLGGFVDLSADESEMITVPEGDELYCQPQKNMDDGNDWEKHYIYETMANGYVFRGECPMVKATVTAPNGIEIAADSTLPLHLKLENVLGFYSLPLYADIRWVLPEGMAVRGGSSYTAFVNQRHCGKGYSAHDIILEIGQVLSPTVTLVLEISFKGLASKIYIPVTLFHTK